MKKQGKLQSLTNGLLKENPVLRLVLGTCPTLAVTTLAVNGIGMGLSATVVLICSNLVISLLRNFIPKQVRIPAYITIIAGFVTIVQLFIKAFFPDIDSALGIFLPLIVVNCIILGRAEMFASKHGPIESVLDGVGMGLGFTVVLFIMASIREIIGSGTWMGIVLTADAITPMGILKMAPGGFFVFGCLMALANWLSDRKRGKPAVSTAGCAGGCAGCAGCAQHAEGADAEAPQNDHPHVEKGEDK